MALDFKRVFAKWILPMLCVVFASVFPVVFLWGNNAGEIINAKTVLVPLLLFAAAGLLVFLLFALFSGWQANKSALCAVAAVLLLSNFSAIWDMISGIIPGFYYWNMISLCVVVLFLLYRLVTKRMNDDVTATLTKLIVIAFSGLLLLNIGLGLPAAVATRKSLSAQENTQINTTTGKPNVYFMIFDEFSNFDYAEKWLDYDNAVLLEALEGKGFNISHTSMNEHLKTDIITVNLVNMDYVIQSDHSAATLTEDTRRRKLRKDSAFFNDFSEAGYSILATGKTARNFYALQTEDGSIKESAETVSGETFQDTLLNGTFLYFVDSEVSNESVQELLSSIAYFENYDNFKDGSCLVFCHFGFPHRPNVVDKDGNLLDVFCYEDESYTLGQYIYASKLIDETTTEIIKNDPNCVIILMSDHSDRYFGSMGADARNIFNAVYYMGEELDIEGLSGINTLRLICNELLGKNYAPVPAENYFVEGGD